MQPIDVELVVGEDDVVHQFTTSDVPQTGELICTFTEEQNSKRTFKVMAREWHSRPWYNLGVILYVEEITDAGVVNQVDTQA